MLRENGAIPSLGCDSQEIDGNVSKIHPQQTADSVDVFAFTIQL